MMHELKTGDISGSDYFTVRDDDYTGQFRIVQDSTSEEQTVMPGLMTLKYAPSGWINTAEDYMQEQGFNVI